MTKKHVRKKHSKEAVLEDIRKYAERHLRENKFENVSVFLIDNHKVKEFDFERPEHRLAEDFPKLQKSALILSLQATSREMIRLKVAELHSRMWKRAASSCVKGAVHDDEVSLAFDSGFVAEEADLYLRQLGLDEVSLSRYSNIMSCDYEKLKSFVDSSLDPIEIGISGAKLVKMLFKVAAPFVKSAVREESSNYIAMISKVIAVPLSFAGTYRALKLELNKMESVALEVVKYAAESANDTELSDNNKAKEFNTTR